MLCSAGAKIDGVRPTTQPRDARVQNSGTLRAGPRTKYAHLPVEVQSTGYELTTTIRRPGTRSKDSKDGCAGKNAEHRDQNRSVQNGSILAESGIVLRAWAQCSRATAAVGELGAVISLGWSRPLWVICSSPISVSRTEHCGSLRATAAVVQASAVGLEWGVCVEAEKQDQGRPITKHASRVSTRRPTKQACAHGPASGPKATDWLTAARGDCASHQLGPLAFLT